MCLNPKYIEMYISQDVEFVRISKLSRNENPYNVIGIIKQTGTKELPKDICKDRIIGTWKADNIEDLIPMKW